MKNSRYLPPVAFISLALSVLSSQEADALSYTLWENLPAQVSVLFETDPNEPIKPGGEFSFFITVRNESAKPVSDMDVELLTNLAPPLELRKVTPHPHLLNDHEEELKYFDVSWENQTIPARSSKKYQVKYRLDPNFRTLQPKDTSQALRNRETISLSVRSPQNTGIVWLNTILPIATAVGSQAPRNGSIVDNIYYAAQQRYPTKAEQTKWKKVYNSLDKNPGPCLGTQSCNKGSFFLKLINDDAKKKPASETKSKSLASISDLNSLFRTVHGRTPTAAEWHYWAGRLLDKSDRAALTGAMSYHKVRGRTTGK